MNKSIELVREFCVRAYTFRTYSQKYIMAGITEP
jgi:hypothetical protein